MFCEDAAQLAKIEQIRDDCPALEHVIALAGARSGSISLEELIDWGAAVPEEEVDARVAAVSADSMASLVYTSGTTGPPKACILTHRNFTEATHALEERLDLTRTDAPIEFFMFLPLAHVFARIVQVFTLDLGGTLIYWQRDQLKLLEDIREARPTYFPSVPRVWEKIYTAATTGVADQPRLKRSIFSWALGVGHRVRELERGGATPGRMLAAQHHLADRLVPSKVRDLFGGRLELAVTAAAPIATDVLEFFDACGILLVEAWGMTETCAAGTINTDLEMKMGTIGKPVPTLEMRVAPDGELLARGANIFGGYCKDEQATKEMLTDGWLATGDLGEIDADGFVSTLDPDEAPKLAERLGISPDVREMTRNERVRAEIQKDVEAVNQHFARIEQIKRFAILGRELTQEDGDLTPTLKVKRAVVYAKFADMFGGLYAD